jgi:hypothetical protein
MPVRVRATGAVRSLLRVSVRQVGRALRCARVNQPKSLREFGQA